MSFPRYSEYKDSGVEWPGEVPEHWDVKRLKHILRLLTEKTDRRENAVALENIESWSGRFIQTETTFEGEGVAFEQGDILFGKLRPYLAKVYLAETSGEAVGDFHVMRPTKNTVGRYAQYQILNREFIAIVDGSTFGAKMPRASWDFMGGMVLAAPPIPEQQTIAAFLDRETAKIDALIAEQQRLIELLKEKRQAVISHAVTKGLNPDAPMKDSGIEWLGEVPEHWAIKRLKHIKALSPNSFVDGPFGSNLKSEHFIDDGNVYVIESNFATQGRLEPSELKTIASEHFETIRRSETKDGDIIIAKIGAQFGKATILPEIDKPAVVSGNSMKLTVENAVCQTLWAYWQLFNLKANGEIDLLVNGSAQPALSLGAMNELVFLLPPLDEQEKITSFLQNQTTKLDDLTAEAQTAITLLQERRTALISAAVTGKIDVRSALDNQENPPCL